MNQVQQEHLEDAPVALITGAAKRLGAEIARTLHTRGFRVILHHHTSNASALKLAQSLNEIRQNSAHCIQANLTDFQQTEHLAQAAARIWGRLDALINNASAFYPTDLGITTEGQWEELLNTNLKAPFFLSQASAAALSVNQGSIINIADIYGISPLARHTPYCVAKAGLIMLTKCLATELAPHVRVNAIAPGTILWPAQSPQTAENHRQKILSTVPLQRRGSPQDIAKACVFLLSEATYINGQTLPVDGGRLLNL